LRNSYFPKFPENNIAADIKTFPAGVDYLSLALMFFFKVKYIRIILSSYLVAFSCI
jgi:hypothetical protein